MKKSLLSLFAFAVLPAGALLAQDLVGTWQGTLAIPQGPNGQVRAVIKISRAPDESLKGAFFPNIDQGGQSLPAGAITLQGSAVKITIPGIGGTVEGKLSADGNSIAATWAQGPKPLPFNLARATAETAWAIPDPPPPPKLMAADANPSFEVATIKPSDPNRPGKAFQVRGREFLTINTTMSDLITFAYGVHVRQITGGPAWLESEKFDITARPDQDGAPNPNQLRTMVQKLLADRFKLAFHRDKKELTVYALTVAKTGPKLTRSDSQGTLPGLFFRGLGNLPARNATMADFAGVMQGAVLDRPVVDQTGITGRYDFTLLWTPDETQFGGLGVRPPPPADNAEAPPDLFTAIQQQLGLKLESTKAPAEVLVIDQVEKPSAN